MNIRAVTYLGVFRSFPPLTKGYRMALALSLFFFLTGLAFGYGFWKEDPGLAKILLDSVMKKFTQLSKQMQNVFWWGQVIIIFLNNLQVTVFMLLIGSILPFIPVLVINSNGMIIGMFAAYFEEEQIFSKTTFFLSLLPHGLFEMTAILLAAAVGMVWGIRNWMGWLRIRPAVGFLKNMKHSFSFFPWIVILLLIAAFIEILISAQILPAPREPVYMTGFWIFEMLC